MPSLTVACKVPNGLILRLFQEGKQAMPVMGGGFRDETVFTQIGDPVTVKGPGHRLDKAPAVPITSGYALTYGVDADFWAKWLEQNKTTSVVKAGLIFAHEKVASTEAQAREGAQLRSGMEPIDTTKLSRGIETAKAA